MLFNISLIAHGVSAVSDILGHAAFVHIGIDSIGLQCAAMCSVLG